MSAGLSSPAGTYGWRPIIIMAALFFSIGFVTWLNGPLITFVQVAFDLSDVAAFGVPICFYLAYLVFPLPATLLAKRIGLRRGLIAALLVMAAGTLLFGECVNGGSYHGALAGLAVIGAGLSLLQVTINPYVSLLGAPHRAAQRIAIMGTANKVAGIIAPALFAALVMPHVGEVAAHIRDTPAGAARAAIVAQFTHAVHGPYQAMAFVLVGLAVIVAVTHLPEISIAATADAGRTLHPAWLCSGALAMFLYVGVEVLAGDAIGSFGHALGLKLDVAKYLTAVTLAAMAAGYLAGMAVVPRLVSQERWLVVSCALGVVLSLAAAWLPGRMPVGCVALLGFANAMILPALFPVIVVASGAAGAWATALLVMAFSGGAVLPAIYVHLAAVLGPRLGFASLAVPSYVLIALWMLAAPHGAARRGS